MIKLNQKTALITGISSGIGMATCKLLIQNGYFVYGTYNNHRKEALKLKAELKNLEVFKVDFSNRGQTVSFVKKLEEKKLDVIINNAGTIDFQDFGKYDLRKWDDTFEVNLNTPLILVNKLQNQINDNGAIVNIASTDGMTGTFGSIAYSASKAALINLTKSLGNILGPRNIRVNAIAPGWINTGMDTSATKNAASLTPLGRNGKPEEIAEAVNFLIGPKSSFINGATIVIDGGYTNVDSIMKKEVA